MFEPVLIAIWVVLMLAFNIPMYYLLKRNGIPQKIVLVASLLMAGAMYAGVERLLSYPMPMHWELWPAKSYDVIAFDIRRDLIYILLDDGHGIPRYYVVPIGDKKGDLGRLMAEKLPGLAQEAREMNGSKLKYEPSLGQKEGSPLFVKLPEAPGPKRVE